MINDSERPICPYCKIPAELVHSSVVYGPVKEKDYGWIWLCANFPHCDARVGVHKDSYNTPLGTLANLQLSGEPAAGHTKLSIRYGKSPGT